MTDNQIVHLGLQAMTIAAKLGAPDPAHRADDRLRHLAVPVGDPDPGATLSFVPKAVGVGVALLISGNWMLHEMVHFTDDAVRARSPTLLKTA